MYSPINTIIKNNTNNTIYFSGTPKGFLAVSPNGTFVYNGDLYTALITGRATDDLTKLISKGDIELSYEVESAFNIVSVDKRILTLCSDAEASFKQMLAQRKKKDVSLNKENVKKEVSLDKEQVKEELKDELVKPVVEEATKAVVEKPAESKEEIKQVVETVSPAEPVVEAEPKKKRSNKKIKVD